MSSISSSDRARQNDELRQAREEYQTSEVETAKRNKSEKKRMQERHDQEVARLREEYDNQMSTLRNKHKGTLNSRDQEHRDQMDKIKSLYVDQMRRKTEDFEAQRKEQARTYEAELEQEKKADTQQKENLTRGFRDSLQERDEQFTEFQANAQKEMRDSLSNRTEKLTEKYQKDVDVLANERDEKVANLTRDRAENKSAMQREINDLKRSKRSELTKKDEHWRSVVEDQGKMHDELLTNRNQVLAAERRSMINKMNDVQNSKLEHLQGANETLRDQVQDRLDGQVRSLQSELQASKSDRVVDMITNRRLRDLERKHLEEAQYKRLQDLEGQRSEILGQAKERTAEKIDDIVRRADRIVQDTNRSNRMKQNIQGQQAKEDRAQLQFELKSQVTHANDQADKRIRRIQDVTNETTQYQQKYYNDNLDQLKNNYADNLTTQRESQLEATQGIRLRAEDKLRENDVKAAKKLETTVANYEAKIEKMREDQKSEKARLTEMYENRMKQREKGFRVEQETQAIKYESKLAQSDELRQKEIERIERRSQEQMANLSERMKRYEKKA